MLPLTRTPSAPTADDIEALGFGRRFSRHMLLARYKPGPGWSDASIVDYAPLSLDPATMALHYGQSVFEGLKAFRGIDGVVRLFRPERYVSRLRASSQRLCIPAVDEETVLGWLTDFLRSEALEVPSTPGSALYLRLLVFAADPFIGVRPSETYVCSLIASPVDAYYAGDSLRLLVEERDVRSVEGGIGAAKTGGNYAAGLRAEEAAHAAGYDQVIWLDGRERRYLEEAGTMNVMLRIGDEVVTPPLGGSILDGVTRDSVLTLLRDFGVTVSERPVAIDEVIEAADAGRLREAWGTGTAAGIASIASLGYGGRDYALPESTLANRLKQTLEDIQYARAADPHGWLLSV